MTKERERAVRKSKERKAPKIKEILFLQRLKDDGMTVTMDEEDDEMIGIY
jgi:hypothetical protein